MSEWRAIHPSISIKGADGFRMLRFEMPSFSKMRQIQAKLTDGISDPYEETIRRLVPEGPIPTNPRDALKKYYTEHASYSFCVGDAKKFDPDNRISTFLIGFRSEMDMFKFLLTWPEAEQVSTWKSNIKFFVRIAKEDDKPLINQ